MGLIEERLWGIPATLHYRLNLDLLIELADNDFQQQLAKKQMVEEPPEKNQDCFARTI
jgi:hypothetical protein